MASKNNKPVLQAKTIQRKEFDYTLGGVNLNFKLRTDVKVELKAFKELMERGIEDINAELAAMKTK